MILTLDKCFNITLKDFIKEESLSSKGAFDAKDRMT